MSTYDDPVYLDGAGRARLHAPEGREAFDGWHPLSWMSLRLDDRVFGTGVRGHHLGNVLLHGLSAATVFLLLHTLTGATWRSAAAALLFAIHPLRVEPVAWIAERKEVQAGFFAFLTLLAYTQCCHEGSAPATRIGWYLAVLALLATALFSKPTTVTLPCVMLLLDYWPMQRWSAMAAIVSGPPGPAMGETRGGAPRITRPVFSRHSAGFLLIEKMPMFALVALSAVITYRAQTTGGALSFGDRLSFSSRVANAMISYLRYLARTAWFSHIAIAYPFRNWPVYLGTIALVVVVAITLAVAYQARRRPWLAVGWCWFIGVLVPMIGLIQAGSQAMADRYTYIPSVGLFVALIWSIPSSWAMRRASSAGMGAAAIAIAMALIFFTRNQLDYWQDDVSLFSHSIAVTADNAEAQGMLGNCLLNQNRLADAEPHLRESLRLNPIDVPEIASLSKVVGRMGRHSEAISLAQRAVAMAPNRAYTHLALGEALAGDGQSASAAEEFSVAIRLAPHDPRGHFQLGSILAQMGHRERADQEMQVAMQLDPSYALSRASRAAERAAAGDFSGAAREYETALGETPGSFQLEIDYGALLSDHGDHASAMKHFDHALALSPGNAVALVNRGIEYQAMNQPAAARADFENALAIDPDNADAQLNLGGLLLSLGQDQSALPHCRRALQLRPDLYEAAYNLAVAEADIGSLSDAREHYQLALKLRPNDPDSRRGLAQVSARLSP